MKLKVLRLLRSAAALLCLPFWACIAIALACAFVAALLAGEDRSSSWRWSINAAIWLVAAALTARLDAKGGPTP